jgi:hypothetical protein
MEFTNVKNNQNSRNNGLYSGKLNSALASINFNKSAVDKQREEEIDCSKLSMHNFQNSLERWKIRLYAIGFIF